MEEIALIEILKAHRRHRKKGCVPSNLGDGYLFHHNPVYRNCRKAVLDLGCKFTSKDTFHYFGWPFIALNDILLTKEIPVIPNFDAVEKLEKNRPGFFKIGHLAKYGPNKNYFLHESAHLIADAATEKILPRSRLGKISAQAVLPYFFAEACANAVETLCHLYNFEPIGRFFVEMNTYSTPAPELQNRIFALIKNYGDRTAFELLVAAFLHLQMVSRKAGREEVPFMRDALGIEPSPVDVDLIAGVLQLAGIDRQFRKRIGEMYLNFVGLEGSLEDAACEDVRPFLKRGSPLTAAIHEVSRLVFPENVHRVG